MIFPLCKSLQFSKARPRNKTQSKLNSRSDISRRNASLRTSIGWFISSGRVVRRWVSRIRESLGTKVTTGREERLYARTEGEERNRKSLSPVHASRAPFVVNPDDGDRGGNVAPRSTFLTSHVYVAPLTRWDQTVMVIKANGTAGRDSGNFRERILTNSLGQLASGLNFSSPGKETLTGQIFQNLRDFLSGNFDSTLIPQTPSNFKYQCRISRHNIIRVLTLMLRMFTCCCFEEFSALRCEAGFI